jgi:hypothetical protein
MVRRSARESTAGAYRLTCLVALALALVGAALAARPAGAATTSFIWTGADMTTPSSDWSDAMNWAGDAAPTAGSTIDTLTFPELTSSDCNATTPVGACYTSSNDVGNLNVGQLEIDGSDSYDLTGDGITVDGGVTMGPGSGQGFDATVSLPITLGADQTWDLEATADYGSLLYLTAPLTGDHALTLPGGGGGLIMSGDNEIGPVTISGQDGPTGCSPVLGLVRHAAPPPPPGGLIAPGGELNATDGNMVTLTDAYLGAVAVALGPLSSVGSCTEIGLEGQSPTGSLSVASATFDATSDIGFNIAGGDVPGADYSQLTSTGAIDLGGAGLDINSDTTDGYCVTPSAGQAYTLVSTTGTLTGTFGNAPNGAMIEDDCAGQSYEINYNTNTLPRTVTATAVGATTSTSLALLPVSPVTNQTVLLSATVDAQGAPVTGAVAFEEDGVTIPGCGAQPIINAFGASCDASFAADASPLLVSAVFTPAASTGFAGSSVSTGLIVSPDPTSTALASSSANPRAGTQVTYAAIVTPAYSGARAPSGSVAFFDGHAPMASCTGEPVEAQGSFQIATCKVHYHSGGYHAITARYAGDGNFAASASSPAAVTISGNPSVSRGSIRGVAEGRATLAFTASAGLGAPGLTTIILGARGGIRFVGGKGIVVRGRDGERLKFKTRVLAGTVRITLAAAAPKVQVTVASPAITLSTALVAQVADKHTRAVPLDVTLTDAGHTMTALTLKLRAS